MSISLGIYHHLKGGVYRLLYIGVHSETLEEYAIYQSQADTSTHPKGTVFVRLLKMFVDKVTSSLA